MLARAAAALIGALAALVAVAPAYGRSPGAPDLGQLSAAPLQRIGPAPASLPVTLQLGLVADQKGIAGAARAGSDPGLPSYGRYPTLPELRRRFGAPPPRLRAVLTALRRD